MMKFPYNLEERLRLHLEWAPQENKTAFLVLALCGEAGELANLVKKDLRGDEGDRSEEFRKELTDVFNYAFMVAIQNGIDPFQAMDEKLSEVEERPAFKKFMESRL